MKRVVVMALTIFSIGAPLSRTTNVDGSGWTQDRVEHFSAPVLSLDFAQWTDLAATALSNGLVKIWHLDSGVVVHEIRFSEPETDQRQKDEGEVEPIRTRFSPDGTVLAVSYLSRIHLYAVATWSEFRTLGVTGEDTMSPLTPPHLSRRASPEKASDDINTGTRKWAQRKMQGDGRTRIADFTFTPDGSELVAAYCRISCYDVPGGVRWIISKGHESVRLWDVNTGQMLWEHASGANQITYRVVVSPDGEQLVEVVFRPGHWELKLRRLRSNQESAVIPLSLIPHDPPDIAFLADGERFVSLWSKPHDMWQVAMLDSNTGQVLTYLRDRAGAQHLAISKDGIWLAATTWRRPPRVNIWDLREQKITATIKPGIDDLKHSSLDVIRFAGKERLAICDPAYGTVFSYRFME